MSKQVPLDRREKDRRTKNEPVSGERRKVARRRQIDPTTCERDYSDDEIEFMRALDEYKRCNGRMFPTCSEILEVIRDLGYVKTNALAAASTPIDADASDEAGEDLDAEDLDAEGQEWPEDAELADQT